MTFAIVLCNADQIIQVSDRRLTAANNQLVDASANKAGHVICDDASFLYCFTGLARVGTQHVTSRWLLDAFYGAADRTRRYRQLVDELADEAQCLFRSSVYLRALSPAARRLTVMISGYTARDLIVTALISNFQDV